MAFTSRGWRLRLTIWRGSTLGRHRWGWTALVEAAGLLAMLVRRQRSAHPRLLTLIVAWRWHAAVVSSGTTRVPAELAVHALRSSGCSTHAVASVWALRLSAVLASHRSSGVARQRVSVVIKRWGRRIVSVSSIPACCRTVVTLVSVIAGAGTSTSSARQSTLHVLSAWRSLSCLILRESRGWRCVLVSNVAWGFPLRGVVELDLSVHNRHSLHLGNRCLRLLLLAKSQEPISL